MSTKDTNKLSNLDILNTKYNFKILELEGLNLDDDWSKLSKVKKQLYLSTGSCRPHNFCPWPV